LHIFIWKFHPSLKQTPTIKQSQKDAALSFVDAGSPIIPGDVAAAASQRGTCIPTNTVSPMAIRAFQQTLSPTDGINIYDEDSGSNESESQSGTLFINE
jgi:hypothetical protein